jgi:glycosyltransferase involved in cell wall biosynthesis
MEAAASGRFMIATDAPGYREVVIDDQTGLLLKIRKLSLRPL